MHNALVKNKCYFILIKQSTLAKDLIYNLMSEAFCNTQSNKILFLKISFFAAKAKLLN